MKILLVTEKHHPTIEQRDGGFQLVKTLEQIFKNQIEVMQFSTQQFKDDPHALIYPFSHADRFQRRILNADFVQEKVIEKLGSPKSDFTHIFYIHISMQFGIVKRPLGKNLQIWTFPMFLTPSYKNSGEEVPSYYFDLERQALQQSQHILTPSPLEKRQLLETYGLSQNSIHMVPRGVNQTYSLRTFLNEGPAFCSIGTIKRQKNTLALIYFFNDIKYVYPKATLKIIGAVQDEAYAAEVLLAIKKLRLDQQINLMGYIPHADIPKTIADCHMHLSTSCSETFGRSIFETLAMGIPNIARRENNAAYDFLKNKPYICFSKNTAESLTFIQSILANFKVFSEQASEIGFLFNEDRLQKLLKSTILKKEAIVIADFDGTLFHKNDFEKTKRCIFAFNQFPLKVICSARSKEDLLNQSALLGIKADWIISYGGAVISNVSSNAKREDFSVTPLDPETLLFLENTCCTSRILYASQVLQLESSPLLEAFPMNCRVETYQNKVYLSSWAASKLHAILKLLNHIEWEGCIQAFGDGPYDEDFLTYFDGTLITPTPTHYNQKKEMV